MNELALFAGAGGGILGGILSGFRTVCAVEIDPFCREVLLRRQLDGCLPKFPIWDDIRTFDGRPWRGKIDVITAGFPCQPFSVAGKGQAENDERNMWPDTVRILREIRPRYALLENVPGLLAHEYIHTIFGQISESGYDAVWKVISAAEVGAPHKRDRLWIMGHAKGKYRWNKQNNVKNGAQGGCGDVPNETGGNIKQTNVADTAQRPQGRECQELSECTRKRIVRQGCSSWWLQDPAEIPDADGEGLQVGQGQEAEGIQRVDARNRKKTSIWPVESFVGGMAYELACGMDELEAAFGGKVPRVATNVGHRVDRLKAIGNGQVPAVASIAWEILSAERLNITK